MDTIDVELKLNKKLPKEVVSELRNLEWISRFRTEDGLQYRFVISFPKYFYSKNNAYLVETQDEVNMVLGDVYNIFKKYGIEEAYTKRIDYPFTYLMPAERTFSSYFHLFRLVAIIRQEKSKGNGKFYGSLSTEAKESLIYTNTANINTYSKRALIYNQALKIKETKPSTYQETLKNFPDLKNRMRIEISFKENLNFLGTDGFQLDIEKIKRKYVSYLANHILNPNRIDEGIKTQIDLLVTFLKEKYINKNSDCIGRIKWNEAFNKILHDPHYVFSKDIFNKAINEIYTSSRSKEDARRRIRNLAEISKISYEYIINDMKAIMLSILEQYKKS